MKTLILVLGLSIFLLPALCQGQAFKLKDIKTNTVKKDYKKILIVGIGSVETRLCLENISARLSAEFKSHKIESEFQYLGRDSNNVNEKIKNLLLKKFDAIMIFSPIDSSYFSVKYSSYDSFVNTPYNGGLYFTTTNRNIIYSQNIYIKLYEISNNNDLIWSATLFVDFDPTVQYVYLKITKKLISSLRTNQILR